MIVLMLLMLAGDPDALLANARALTAAEPPCIVDPNSTDVTVCGRREADHYRVPFIVHDPGDPAYETVSAERQRLLHRTTPLEELSPFQVGGGMAGVQATANASGAHAGGLRPLAP